MANNELLDLLAPSAESDLTKVLKSVQKIGAEVDRVNSNPLNVGGRGGRGGNGNNRQLLAEIDELNRKLSEQASAIDRLTQARARSNQRTQDEITNNRLLAQNASLAAQANSTFANSYQRLSAQQAIAARNVQNLIARGREATQTQRQYDAELRVAQNEFNRLNTRVLAADRAVGRFNRNVGNYPMNAIRSLKDLVGAFGLVGGVTAFAMITKDIFNTTRELQGLELALKNVTGSQEAFGESQQFLLRISEAYGIEINGLTRSYTGFLAASQNAIDAGKITATQIQDIFESVSKASGAMGLSVDQQQGAFLALQQMISKGNVQAEEIRGQLAERLPGAFGILAKSMGVTEEQLNKLLKDGKVLAAEVLPAFARELEKAYGVENLERVESLAASTTRLDNAWTNLIRTFSEGDGIISKTLIGLISGLEKIAQGYEFLFQNDMERTKTPAATIYNKTLKDQIEYYKNLGQEEAKLQAQYNTPIISQRIKELEDQNKELNDNIDSAKNLASQIKLTWFNFGENSKNRATLKELNQNIETMTAQSKDNTLALALNKAMLQAANKVTEGSNSLKKESTELSKKEIKELERLRKERLRLMEEELQNQYRLRKLILESEASGFEDIMNDVSLYYAQREEAANDYTQKEIALAELTRIEGLRKAKDNKTLQLIVWEEYYKDFEELSKKGEANIRKLQEDSFKEFTDYHEKFKGEGLNVISTEDLASQFFSKQADDAEKAAEKVKQLRDATNEYIKAISSDFLTNAGLGSLNLFTALDENGKSPFDKLIEGADSVGEKFAVTFNAIGNVAKEAFAFINQNSQAYFDAEASRLQRAYDLEISFNEGSETAKAEIKRQYDEKQRELRRRETQAQKEQALFNIAINTAQGVVAALTSTPPNVPLSIIIGAIGAAQAALVSSREIPAYKMGTDNHKGGLAIVGDGGKHELVHQPTLGWGVTPATDTLVNLEKGSKVFPDLSKIGLFDSGLPDMIKLNTGGITDTQLNKIVKSISKAKSSGDVINIGFDKRGFNTSIENASGVMHDRNNYLAIKGKRV